MSMLEKVARAITKQALKDAGVYEKLDHIKKITMVEENWRSSEGMAKAAMEALQEPTDEMCNLVTVPVSDELLKSGCTEYEIKSRALWKAMMKEALK